MSQRPRWPGKKDGDQAHERIAACLATDIQTVPEKAKWVLSEIDAVQAGKIPSWEMGMNAFMLHVRRETTDISPVYEETGDPTITVQTADLRKALVAWCQQISKETD